MPIITVAEHYITTVRRDAETLTDWLYDYWWVILLAIGTIGAFAMWIYSRHTRLHQIILYVGTTSTTVYVQHGTTYSAPIPEGEGAFKGWFRDSACMIPFNSSDKIVSDITLYSKFE